MIRRIINAVKNYKGFLSARGKIFDYKEWHSFALGIMSGRRGKYGADEAYHIHQENMSHKVEWHYFYRGYTLTSDPEEEPPEEPKS